MRQSVSGSPGTPNWRNGQELQTAENRRIYAYEVKWTQELKPNHRA